MTENEREEAIRIIKSECYISDLLDLDRTRMVNSALDAAIEALMAEGEIYDIEYSKWIPVSEMLPEKNVEVLATTEWGVVTISEMYRMNDWFIHEGTMNVETDDIVAWMPLPKPYKSQESEDVE